MSRLRKEDFLIAVCRFKSFTFMLLYSVQQISEHLSEKYWSERRDNEEKKVCVSLGVLLNV